MVFISKMSDNNAKHIFRKLHRLLLDLLDEIGIFVGNEHLKELKELVLDNVVPFVDFDDFLQKIKNFPACLIDAFLNHLARLSMLTQLQYLC